ncbi:MAG: hypothetical protein E6I17_03280 [Chloroflexi bacterium]|nr:MAG: hypothetical protein E6I17_03280 [Chloroflexota bacterium]
MRPLRAAELPPPLRDDRRRRRRPQAASVEGTRVGLSPACRFSPGPFVVLSESEITQKESEMANFILVYSGGSAGATEAERETSMQAWGGWFGKLGDKVVDAGNPFSEHAKNISNGTVHDGAIGTPATGYSILKADSLNAAAELARGCPVLQSGGKITVYEITPAM